MNILEHVHERLTFDKDEVCPGGEQDIEKVIGISPIPLPQDYINFLGEISGEGYPGPGFQVDGNGLCIWIWSAEMALLKLEEFDEPYNQEFLSDVWLFGNDLGDLVYFFGTGKDGFGLYRTEDGTLSLEYSEKIADTLTDFLVKGIGIDIATTL